MNMLSLVNNRLLLFFVYLDNGQPEDYEEFRARQIADIADVLDYPHHVIQNIFDDFFVPVSKSN